MPLDPEDFSMLDLRLKRVAERLEQATTTLGVMDDTLNMIAEDLRIMNELTKSQIRERYAILRSQTDEYDPVLAQLLRIYPWLKE